MVKVDPPAFRASLAASAPPEGLSPPAVALWWLAKGGFATGAGWEKAHTIAQSAEGEPQHDWVHAFVHRIEGDTGNAAYWYRRAGKPAFKGTFADEWEAMAEALLG